MELNAILFPAPKSSYSLFQLEQFILIPRKSYGKKNMQLEQQMSMNSKDDVEVDDLLEEENHNDINEEICNKPIFGQNIEQQNFQQNNINYAQKIKSFIPCLYMPYQESSQFSHKYFLYFHANAEDIGQLQNQNQGSLQDLIHILRNYLKGNFIAVEYPGYGMYSGEPSSEILEADAQIVYDFLTNELSIDESNIIVMGRSIGSGPAAKLAANNNPCALILISAYTSIHDIVECLAGKWAQLLMADRFQNIKMVQKLKCKSLFLHGKKDRLIPYTQSEGSLFNFSYLLFYI